MGFYNNLCPGCMNEVGEEESCPYCGFDMNAEQVAPYLAYGTVLAGKYVIGDILEQNSEGVTYLGIDTVTNNCVRIREFLPGLLCTRITGETRIEIYGEKQVFKNLMNEFLGIWHKLMKMRSIENIISVLDVFESNDTAYAVAEADGSQTLSDYLEENGGVMNWDNVKEKLFPVLDVLQRLNENGIIHGAISPDTLFLCNNEKFKLWGFGVPDIRKTEGLLPADIRPGYAAIEQYGNSLTLSSATDVYGFACVLFECVTGDKPIDAQIRYDGDTMNIPADSARELSDYVLAALIGALQIQPSDRTANIEEFKLSFTKEAFERKKLQAAAIAGSSLIDPISEIEDIQPPKVKTVAPVVVNSTPDVPVLTRENTPERTASNSATIVLSISIVLIMLIFFSALALTGIVSFNFGSGSMQKVVEMPDFMNISKDDAYIEEIANTYGLHIKLEPASSDVVAEGVIFEQNVVAGTKIARGSTVILKYSKGFSSVTLPNFTGMPFTETVYYLGKLNLSYNIVEKENPGTQTAGHVATMTPASGSLVTEGTEITIEIWGDAPENGEILGPNTGSSVSSSNAIIDSIFGSLTDSLSDLGGTIQDFIG